MPLGLDAMATGKVMILALSIAGRIHGNIIGSNVFV